MPEKTHLYIFLSGSTHLGFGFGACAHDAYIDMRNKNPKTPALGNTVAWRLAEDAQQIPVKEG